MPEGVTFDSRSFAPQLRGEKGNPRDWVYVQLGANWYVREQGFKLTQNGELFDMSDAPLVEKAVAADTTDQAAVAARARLQAVLDQLSPATGKTASPEKKKAKAGKQKRKRKQ
jgi:arylsulfatase A